MDGVAAVFLLFAVPLYFLPAIVAIGRGHRQLAAIIALNVLLGWTLLGWVAAFVWSMTASENEQRGVTYLSGEGRPAEVDGEAAFQDRIGRLVLWIGGAGVLLIAAMALLR